jgi:hypothetical protein
VLVKEGNGGHLACQTSNERLALALIVIESAGLLLGEADDRALDFGVLKAGITGTLDLTFLLEMATLDNDTQYGVNFLVADVGMVMGMPGDYNNDGTVDAADYIVWKKTDGTPQGYDRWRVNFGATSSSATVFAAATNFGKASLFSSGCCERSSGRFTK